MEVWGMCLDRWINYAFLGLGANQDSRLTNVL
jgi:hypothetical protein